VSTGLILGLAGSYAVPAGAQQSSAGTQQQNNTLEEITVTGTRIRRRDYQANSPIVTVNKNLFDQSSTAAIETQLNRMPQFTPTLDNPTQGGDIQPNARNTPGIASISLRGLGANRSLVLINGRRVVPSNASMVVDINTIPQAAIERVEAISGGASATYGADAVAGAVNFILRDNFEGMEINAQTSSTQRNDDFEYNVSGIMGSNFAGGKGNVTFAFQTNKRNKALQRDRKWYRELWADPSIGGTQFFPPFSGYNTGFANLPDPSVLNARIDGANFTAPPLNATIYADSNGNAFSGFDTAGVPGASGAKFIDGERFVRLNNGQIGVNNTANYLILPLRRYNTYSHARYDISDKVSAFAEGYFSKTSTKTTQEPVPIVSGWSVNIDPTIDRNMIPSDLLAILDSRPNPNAPFSLRALLPFQRTSKTDVDTFNLVAGLNGKFLRDWTWEVFTAEGQAQTTVLQKGFASLQRMRAVMQAPNFGQGFTQKGNSGPPDFGFGGSTATCTSGLNPFAWDSVSQDCFDAIGADIGTKERMEQKTWQTNLEGPLGMLPAGQVRLAAGLNYRRNDYTFQNDTLVTQGRSFLEQAAGLYPAGNSDGETDVKEAYTEFSIPVVSGKRIAQELDFDIGARTSDYNTTGTSNTYKFETNWQVNNTLRIRGGFNRAERAPNIAELYLAAEQTFAVAPLGDVCSTNNSQSYSANKAVDPAHWQDVVNLCGQLMQASGSPTADQQFYGISAAQVAAGASPTNPQAAGPAFLFPTTVGNANLNPEQADTWTLGAVINLAFNRGLASDLQLSVDYYDIDVRNAIGEQSPDIVMRQCVDPAFNPTFDVNSPYCAGFKRNATGAIGNLQRTFFNNGRFRTKGVDLQANWSFKAGPGELTINPLLNVLMSMKSAELPTDKLVDYAGTFGPSQNGLNGSAYDYRALTTFTYSINKFDVTLRWQNLPSIKAEAAATNPNTTITGAPGYNLYGLLARYNVSNKVALRFGVQNVLDTAPPLTGRDTNPTPPTLAGGSFNSNNYDTIGRRMYVGATIDF
jgi:outer membrane receptor protein involved in Fe transport